MTSMFDYDDSVNLAYKAKQAGKNLVTAKHNLLDRTGDFLFLAHSDREFALRCQMVEKDIEKIAFGRLAKVSDSKAKLVHAVYDEWKIRHASCEMCKVAAQGYNAGADEPDPAPVARTQVKDYGEGRMCTKCGMPTLHEGEAMCSGCTIKTQQKPYSPGHVYPEQPQRSLHNEHPIPFRDQPTN